MNKQHLLSLLGLGAAGLAAYARFVEPGRLAVHHIHLPLPRLPRAFHNYRIVHISDIHLGGWMTPRRLTDAIRQVNQLEPDLVAITGDFVERVAHNVADDLIAPLKQLQPRDATVAVLGNHDYRYGVDSVRRALRQSGVIELSNAIHTIQRDDAALYIAGLDDQVMDAACLDTVLDQLPDSGAAILLAHEPDFADVVAATERFDLQLSGHTHGGQVRLPLLGIMPMLPTYGKRYPSGQYQVGKMIQYTNRGLGMIRPAVRLNCRPELTLHILESTRQQP